VERGETGLGEGGVGRKAWGMRRESGMGVRAGHELQIEKECEGNRN